MLIVAAQEAVDSGLSDGVVDAIVIPTVLVASAIASFALRAATMRLVRSIARRSLDNADAVWRARLPRLFGETAEAAELRRQQRIDATGAMIGRIGIIVVWIVAALIIIHRLDVDVILAISGAGFLGAGLAIGGQHSVADYLNGLHILLEDRYGEGDDVTVVVDGQRINGTVSRLTSFATRLETDEGTVHLANRTMAAVTNHSQRGSSAVLTLDPSPDPTPRVASLEALLRTAYERDPRHQRDRDGLVLDRIERRDGALQLHVRTARRLTRIQKERLEEAAAHVG